MYFNDVFVFGGGYVLLLTVPQASSPRTLLFSQGKYSYFSEKMPSVWQLFVQTRGLVRSGTNT